MRRKRKSATPDTQKRFLTRGGKACFVRIYSDLIESDAFRNLSFSAQMLFIRMALEAGRQAAKGQTTFTFSAAVYSKYFSRATFHKARKELEEQGFITSEVYLTTRAKYRLSEGWKKGNQERPP